MVLQSITVPVVPLVIQLKSAFARLWPQPHLFSCTGISFTVRLACQDCLWVILLLYIPKVPVPLHFSGRASVGSFPPHGRTRAKNSWEPGCSPQGPGPHLPFLTKCIFIVGCDFMCMAGCAASAMGKVRSARRMCFSAWTLSTAPNSGSICRTGLQLSKSLSGRNSLECNQVATNMGSYKKFFLK